MKIDTTKSKFKKILTPIKIIVELIIFFAAMFFIHEEIKKYTIAELKASVIEIPYWAILLIILFVCLDYFILTRFDILALKNEKYSFSNKKTTFISFISFAFANSIGLSGITASGIRINLYSIWGIPYKTIMNIVIFCYITFWLGLFWIGGFFLTFFPVSLTHLKLPLKITIDSTFFIGIILLIGASIFTGIIIKKQGYRKEIFIHRILLALGDWITLSLVLYFALPPHNRIDFLHFLSIFIIAQILGFISNIPGGIGVFDLTFLTLLSNVYTSDKIIGALLIYRIAYFFIPLLVAFILYGMFRLTFKRKKELSKTLNNLNSTDEAIKSCIALSNSTDSYLALLGDKEILFDDSKKSFIMFAKSGRSFISMGEPIGDISTFQDCIWKFHNYCRENKKETVFYEISKDFLNYFLDIGLSFLKIGEYARVNLNTFTLDGHEGKEFRHAFNKLDNLGYSFEVIPIENVPQIMEDLKSISDEWLLDKNAKEKGFSLGKFTKEYISLFPIGVIKKDGRIIAFGNILTTNNNEEISLDLMRYRNESPNGTMDYFFICTMKYGKDLGFKYFRLGMAPLAGIEDNTASFWNKIENVIFSHGEHFYNFKGLRAFKDKFNPEWEPRYIAYSGPFNLPNILKDITLLISGGMKGLISKK
ncbi:phosphatidylglycerol lysyltransferase domain-containing protein [Cetobacterium sp.]|uniref:phosphatidylglycerol lysyltransferase domain-containing protein n=2 Tax=Cetobacterium sp. TaxID=2071632 RepID=UPI002FC5853C